MERIVYMKPEDADRALATVEALIEEGIIAKEDEISVVLKADDPRLTSGRSSSLVRVVDIFRDGEGSSGAIDGVENIYRVDFP